MIDLLEKTTRRSSAEFLEEELRCRLLSETLRVTEKFRLQVLLHCWKDLIGFDRKNIQYF